MDIKVLTRMGLAMMTPEAREERLGDIIKDNEIDAASLAALINESRDACYKITEREVESVTEEQKIQIRWMLAKIDGTEEVEKMDPDDLAEWVLDLKKSRFSFEEKASIVKAIMGME